MEQACDVLGWRLPRSRFTTREAPHRFLSGTQEEAPADYHYVGFQTEIHFKPRASPQAELRPGRLPTSRTTYDQEAPHKQNYNQGAYVPTSRITTREPMYPQAELQPGTWLARWLAELHTTRVPVMRLAGWLAGGLAGWLAAAKRGPDRPRKAERG